MIQRYLFDLLTEGFKEFKDSPDLIDDLFQNTYGLEEEEIASIKKFFAAKYPVIMTGYRKFDASVPGVIITLAQEGESDKYMGDDPSAILDMDDPLFDQEVKSSIWQHNYAILVFSEHPDITACYYEMAKSILLVNLSRLAKERGIFGANISGQDLMVDPRYFPEYLAMRQLMFTCQKEFSRWDKKASQKGKAKKVSGIHVDKSGSSRDVGGVKTLVTTFEDDDGSKAK